MLIVGTKRDIDSEFTRRRLHPDGAGLFGTEFNLSKDTGDTAAPLYLAFPCGFTGSPGIFGRIAQAVRFYRRQFSPPTPIWSGKHGLEAEVVVDDGMFVAVGVGNRPFISSPTWEFGADLFPGFGSISKPKLATEGFRALNSYYLDIASILKRIRFRRPTPRYLDRLIPLTPRSPRPVV